MNCQEFWDRLPDRAGELTEAHTAHLAACPACAAQWAPQQTLATGLAHLREEWRSVEAPARVEAGLMSAFGAQNRRQPRPSAVRSWWKPVFVWTSAATAMTAIGLLLSHGYQPKPASPGTGAAPHRQAPPIVQASMTEADPDDEASVLGEGFVRLPNAPRLGENDYFNVVRVEVPGSAIIEAGISLNEEQAGATVLADVALAADGTPRAVRLVGDGGSY